MTAVAKGLKLPGGHGIQHIDASLTGGLAPDATLAVMAKLTGHLAPSGNLDTSIAGATLIARGTTSDHSLELNATSASQQPIVRSPAAVGDGAWRGSLVAASGRPLELAPAHSGAGCRAADVVIRPADFEMRGQFTAVELRRQEARWRFVGNFHDLHPHSTPARAPRGSFAAAPVIARR
jgi:hypothetical protein